MKQATSATAHTNAQVTSQAGVALLKIAFRVSFVMTIGVIGLIGIWAVASLVGGAASAGGALELVQGWFSAVTGL